jgi:hypothetical protein
VDLLPFASVVDCSKCGKPVEGFSVEYSTHQKVDAGMGRFTSVQTWGDSPVPHLEKHCPHCGYGWLEKTKDAG